MNHPSPGAKVLLEPLPVVHKLTRMLNASWCSLHPDYGMRYIVCDEVRAQILDTCNDVTIDAQAAKELLVDGYGWNPWYVASL